MKIVKPRKFEKIAYSCICSICGTRVEVDKSDLHYAGGLNLYWICPICCFDQIEPIFKINRKKVVYYKEIQDME